MENSILGSSIHSRETFDAFEKLKIYNSLSDQGKVLWEAYREYYGRDPEAVGIDKEVLKAIVDRTTPKHAELFKTLIDGLPEGSGINVVHEAISQKKDKISLDLVSALTSNDELAAHELYREYQELCAGVLVENDNEVVIAPNLTEIFAARSAENRIPLYPEALTQQLEGGPLRGHHVVLFAPTDLGKTLFSLNFLRGFVENGYKTVYVGNEDPLSDLIERFTVCLTGRTKWEVRKHPQKAQALADKKGWHNVVWAPLAPGTIHEIKMLLDEHRPDVLIVDQLRNLDTGDKDYVRTLEKAAQAMRVFAKKYNILVISITQAADSATGKAVLGRGDIDNSNVGIPGTADLMLGIGATEEQEFENIRTLGFPKNKISGNKTPLPVRINHQNMRVE